MATEKVILEVQEGGVGNGQWLPLHMFGDQSAAIFTNPDGGGREFTDQYARDYSLGGQLVIVNTVESGQPAAIAFNLELPFGSEAREYMWRTLDIRKSLRLRWYCGDFSDAMNFTKILMYPDSLSTTKGYNRAPMDNTQNLTDRLRRVIGQRAPYEVELDPLVHVRLANAGTLAINKIISIGYKTDGDGCCGSSTPNDGNKDFIAVTDADGSNLPHLYWTADGGQTIADVTLTGLTNLSALDVVKVGDYIVVCGSGAGGGIAYARWSAIKAGTATWTRSTNVSAGTVVNSLVKVNASVLYAFGNAGAMYKSTDGGKTFTAFGSALSANNFSTGCAVAVNENLVWAGGASGTLVKISNGVASLVTVTGLSTNAVTALAVPKFPDRACELYLGSAAGNIHVTKDTGSAWATRSFEGAGSGSIDYLAFTPNGRGECLFIVQTNGSSQSRVIRDHSGGNLSDLELVNAGSYTNPANSVINSIAVSSYNHALTVGEANGGTGFIGKCAAAA